MRFRRVVPIFGAALTALAIGNSHAAGTNHPGLYGKVFRGPTRPVCAAELPCSTPAKGVMLVFSRAGRSTKSITRRDGSYNVGLAPGTYIVSITPKRTIGAGLRPHTVIVHDGTMTRRNFTIDTGIR
jgi:hypothetical protein